MAVEWPSEDTATLIGIDHGFSFPLRYFEIHGLEPDWSVFLDDFHQHWPTDDDNTYVDFVREGVCGNGAARMGNARWRRLTEERARGAKSVFHFDVQRSCGENQVDFEGEICAVIGRACHNVPVADALGYLAGYTITNDVSARDWVPGIAEARTTPEARAAWDLNHMGKQFPAFAPLGPALVTADEVGDPTTLELTTRLNGEVMQHAIAKDLIFSVAGSLSFFSRWYAFQPGDILSTGTPAGVGAGRNPPVFLKHGDVVEVEVSGLGTLSNRLVSSQSE